MTSFRPVLLSNDQTATCVCLEDLGRNTGSVYAHKHSNDENAHTHFIHKTCFLDWLSACCTQDADATCPLCAKRINNITGLSQEDLQSFEDKPGLIQKIRMWATQHSAIKRPPSLQHWKDWAIKHDVLIEGIISPIVIAAVHGGIEKVRSLRSQDAISEAEFNEIFSLFNSRGESAAIIELLSYGINLCEDTRRAAVHTATNRGDAECIQALLADGATIPTQAREDAVLLATEKGNADCIQALLAQGAIISEKVRGIAVWFAVLKGNADCLQALLTNDSILSEKDRGAAVALASDRGSLPCIQILLADGAIISEKDRGAAVRAATSKQNAACIQALLDHTAPLLKEDRELAIRTAALAENMPCIQALIRGGNSQEEDTGLAVRILSMKGNAEGVRTLLKEGATLCEKDRGWAVINATILGSVETIQVLLAHGAIISDKDRSSAVLQALRQGALFPIPQFRESGQGLQDLRDLLNMFNILWSPRDQETLTTEEKATLLLTQQRYCDCIQALLTDGTQISAVARGVALVAAGEQGCLEETEALLAPNAPIPLLFQKWAIARATKKGHSRCIQSLETHKNNTLGIYRRIALYMGGHPQESTPLTSKRRVHVYPYYAAAAAVVVISSLLATYLYVQEHNKA